MPLPDDNADDDLALDEVDDQPADAAPGSDLPEGYLVIWERPDGRYASQWYKHLGFARRRIALLANQGTGLNPRLFRATELVEMADEATATFDAPLAQARRAWADVGWRKTLLREDPGIADWLRGHPRADLAVGRIASRMGGLRGRRQR